MQRVTSASFSSVMRRAAHETNTRQHEVQTRVRTRREVFATFPSARFETSTN